MYVMKDVIISIIGTQRMEDGTESIELVTDGKYSFDDDKSVLTYMESEITGMNGTKTTFEVGKNLITMIREGTVNSQMIFEKGKKHVFLYETPFGAATLGVNTHRIKSGLGEHGGDMELEYAVDVDNMQLGTNAFRINVKEA
jgi:uncharacterized beta-barrel protein YwiB (DUF1934 family)